ncbi:MAG: GlsB/YeaQ/YmgE family stress response membrane protein [Myxococcales bacterium]
MGIITWIIVGLIAGLVARAIMPGRQPMGLLLTTLLGVVGSVVGGLIGAAVWHRNAGNYSPGGLLLSIAGALLVLILFSFVRRPSRAGA